MGSNRPISLKLRTLFQRTGSTVGIWAVVALGLWSQLAWAYVTVIGLLVVVTTAEYGRMMRSGGIKGFPIFGVLMATLYSVILYWFLLKDRGGGVSAPAGFDAAGVFVVTAGAFWSQLRRPVGGLDSLMPVACVVLGFVYVAVFFNFTARLVFLPEGEGQVPGAMLLLWLIAVTKFADMGAYLTGSAIGKHKMIPRVSPAKTWEGFGGALGFSLLAGCGLFALFPEPLAPLSGWGHVIFLSVLVSLLAILGDLAESVMKRSLAVKDSGHLLPGIGGVLDLIDSLCFTAPVLYFYLVWVTLG